MANEKQKTKIDPEKLQARKEEQGRRGRRRTRQLIGFALSVLMVVGAVSIISRGVTAIQNLTDNTDLYEEYAERITPLVWFEVAPFESLDKVDPNALLQACIWGVMSRDQATLAHDDRGDPVVPAADIDRYAAALFGPDYVVKHGSFSDPVQNLKYEYDPDTKMYTAQATGLTARYVPTVVDIKDESGGVRRVTVGYINTLGSNDELIAAPDLEHPARYMDFLFRREGGNYYLYALANNTELVVATPSNTQQEISESLQEELAVDLSSAASTSGVSSEPSSGSEADDVSDSTSDSSQNSSTNGT